MHTVTVMDDVFMYSSVRKYRASLAAISADGRCADRARVLWPWHWGCRTVTSQLRPPGMKSSKFSVFKPHGHGHGHGLFIKTRVTEKFTPFPRRVPAITPTCLPRRVLAWASSCTTELMWLLSWKPRLWIAQAKRAAGHRREIAWCLSLSHESSWVLPGRATDSWSSQCGGFAEGATLLSQRQVTVLARVG